MIGGAVGDAMGSRYENQSAQLKRPVISYFNTVPDLDIPWHFTDDTQLTLATCEALSDHTPYSTDLLAQYFALYYRKRRITGMGAATLNALRELDAGINWRSTGRTGVYAAGNGAAMRIAPLAFRDDITRDQIREACYITHQNDEAYCGALAVVLTLRIILSKAYTGSDNLLQQVIPQLPDTLLRDRLIMLTDLQPATIAEAAEFGTSGYVVDSVPFALYSASQVAHIGIGGVYQSIIEVGGDTDTNASIAGQIAGALTGKDHIPTSLTAQLEQIPDYPAFCSIVQKTMQTLIGDKQPGGASREMGPNS